MDSRVVLAGICVIVLSIQTTHALQCYYCSPCPSPFKPEDKAVTKMPCSGSCSKLQSGDVSARACFPIVRNECNKETTKDGTSGTVCTCTTDLCNTANQPYTYRMTLLLTAVTMATSLLFSIRE